MRRALVVGIDHYVNMPPLHGCVNDAHSVKGVLERHSDGSVNFGVRILTGTGPRSLVKRAALKQAISDLFSGESDIALLYFAGHGHVEATGGYLIASDCAGGDTGLPFREILSLAQKSATRNRFIVLDCCHSGVAGDPESDERRAELVEGMTILTASTANQYAEEVDGSGVFTTLFVDALGGAAANLVGDITPGSVYAHIDQSLGPWDERPVFKTKVRRFVSLRRAPPPISLEDLRRLPEFFPAPGVEYALDPSYEPESAQKNEENVAKFAVLQRYSRVNLIVPVGTPHMYYAAIESKSCRLTVLGEHYRRLASRKLI